MPSERSSASLITGENAERTKVTSISLQTCCKPLWMTARVTGSIIFSSRVALLTWFPPPQGESVARGRQGEGGFESLTPDKSPRKPHPYSATHRYSKSATPEN